MRANLHANVQLPFSILFLKYLTSMCARVCACNTREGQKMEQGPLELELQADVSCSVVAGMELLRLCKSNECFWLLRHLSSPYFSTRMQFSTR